MQLSDQELANLIVTIGEFSFFSPEHGEAIHRDSFFELSVSQLGSVKNLKGVSCCDVIVRLKLHEADTISTSIGLVDQTTGSITRVAKVSDLGAIFLNMPINHLYTVAFLDQKDLLNKIRLARRGRL